MNSTLGIALWGAVIGTLTFLWNVWKWRIEGPRLLATVEAVPSFSEEDSFAGIRFKLRNRGGKAATVEQVMLYHRQSWFGEGFLGLLFRLRRIVPWQLNAGAYAKIAKFPVEIDSGGIWECFLGLEEDEEKRPIRPAEDIQRLLSEGRLRYSVVCSHTDRRLKGLVRVQDPWPRE